MKKCVLALALTSCGMPVAQDGVDGRSPRCAVEKREGVTYLKCLNPDGSAAEAEISADVPEGESETVLSCKFSSETYAAAFHVLQVSEDLKLSSLHVRSLKASTVVFNGAVLHDKSDATFESAAIKLSAWSAKQVAEKAAELIQVGNKAEAMVCK